MGKVSLLKAALMAVGLGAVVYGYEYYLPAQREQLQEQSQKEEAQGNITLFSPSVLAESNYDGLCVTSKYTIIPSPDENIDEVAKRLNLTGFRHRFGRFGREIPGSVLYDVSAAKLEGYNPDRLDQCTTAPIAEEAGQLVYFITACLRS